MDPRFAASIDHPPDGPPAFSTGIVTSSDATVHSITPSIRERHSLRESNYCGHYARTASVQLDNAVAPDLGAMRIAYQDSAGGCS